MLLSIVLTLSAIATPCSQALPFTAGLTQGLERYVDEDGNVNYPQIAADKTQLFSTFLDETAALCPKTFNKLSVDDRVALVINFYNAWVIEFMTGSDGRPQSILKVRVKGKSVFDAPLIRVNWHSGVLSLNQLEKKILPSLRPDPRYHFALVCGAKSCPKLRRIAYQGKGLDGALTFETRKFLDDTERNQMRGSTWRVSRLFDWYKVEFGTSNEATIDWIMRFIDSKSSRPTQLEFMEYDWSPNLRK